MTKIHTLNVYPMRFALIADASMKFVPMNRPIYADRIEADDQLILRENRTHGAGLTGRTIHCRITHVISSLEMPELLEGYVAVSLKVLEINLVIDSNGGPLGLDQKEGEEP